MACFKFGRFRNDLHIHVQIRPGSHAVSTAVESAARNLKRFLLALADRGWCEPSRPLTGIRELAGTLTARIMAKAPTPGQEDSWEDLAKDLFGIEVNKDVTDEPFEVIDSSSLDPEPEVAEEPVAEEPTEPAATEEEPVGSTAGEASSEVEAAEEVTAEEVAEEADDDSVEDILFEEDDIVFPEDDDEEEVIAEEEPDLEAAAENLKPLEEPAHAADDSDKEGDSDEGDSYWDPLAEWDWSESKGRRKKETKPKIKHREFQALKKSNCKGRGS